MGSARLHDLTTTKSSLGRIASFAVESATGKKANGDQQPEGNLASTLKPSGNGMVDVVKDYRWTLSNLQDVEEVPYILLNEYKCPESSIKKQIDLYAKGIIPNTVANAIPGITQSAKEILDVYKEIFSKDYPTDFRYKFPYFNKTGFALSTPNWESLDSIGESIKQITGGLEDMGVKGAGFIQKGIDLVGATTNAAMNFQYPSVGVADRPRIFMGHSDRSISISFTLYNTVDEEDWQKNRDLAYLLMSQNLFNKRDYTTGVPPVFYDVYVPGQYYCYAAAMTDIKVEYLGNQRLLYSDFIVPDAYQIELTLSEMVKPSKNQFEAITNGAAKNYVTTSTIEAQQQATGNETANTIKNNGVVPTMNQNKQFTGAAYMGQGGLLPTK